MENSQGGKPSLKRTRELTASGKGTETLAAATASSSSSSPPPPPAVRPRAGKKPLHDPIYRIMHRLPRSDVLEVVKCKFGKEHCERAVGFFDDAFMQNPLRRLKLQIGCSGPGGLHLFFPRLFFHRFALRSLDLSRNKLSADDVAALCEGLALCTPSSSSSSSSPNASLLQAPNTATTTTTTGSSSMSAEHTQSPLELLDLSYNLGIGNAGAAYLLGALARNTTIRAVQLVSCSIDDDGAQQLAPLLRARRRPPTLANGLTASVGYTQGFAAVPEQRPYTFFVNLNHNVIGAVGTFALGKGLPSYVSVTLAKQRLKGDEGAAAGKPKRHHRNQRGTGKM